MKKHLLVCALAFLPLESGVVSQERPILTWEPASDGPYTNGAYPIVQAQSGALLAATRDGIYRSTDDGWTWAPCSSLPGDSGPAEHLMVAPSGRLLVSGGWNSVLYADEECGGLKKVSRPEPPPGNADAAAAIATPSGRLLLPSRYHGLLASDDTGATWRFAQWRSTVSR